MPVDLFQLMQERLDWTQQRQTALAENIANSDTPGYRPRDLAPFQSQLARQQIALAATDARHIAPASADPLHLSVRRAASERALDGNGVSLETELTKVADTESAQQVTAQLYTSYMGMFRTAIGKGG